MDFLKIRKKAEFNKVMKQGEKMVFQGFVILFLYDLQVKDKVKLGFIVSSKVGNAVKRNKVKRRLKALSAEILKDIDITGFYICLIGRKAALFLKYKKIKADLKNALEKIN